jgi:hypothetical protein
MGVGLRDVEPLGAAHHEETAMKNALAALVLETNRAIGR